MKRLSLLLAAAALNALAVAPDDVWKTARANGAIVDDIFRRTRKMMHGWLAYADSQTLLLPDGLPGLIRGKLNDRSIYTPHNSGADNYPFLITTAFFTEPALYRGRMMEMLRNEVRYTNAGGGAVPGNLDLKTRKLGPPSFFGAGEYCKDGMVPVTELLGRTPWFYRMVDMMEDFMAHAPVKTRFGNLPDTGAELNGDVLQALARLIAMTGDLSFLKWAEQIGDAYIEEILPGSNYLPAYSWDFDKKTAAETVGLGDHGNEAIVGLVLLQALETELGRPRAESYRPVLRKTFDRVLESANPDGFIYRQIRTANLQPVDSALTDCWGYVYASMYAYYQATGEQKYREAVVRVLKNLAKYRDYDWTKRVNTVDDLADSIEGAIYLVAHEPAPEAIAWIDHSIPKMYSYQQPDGVIERWYGDGNWNRTLLLYAMMKTQGARLRDWAPGVELGAVRSGQDLYLSVHSSEAWSGSVCLDYARHRRVLNLKKDYARLNQWPEWYTVDENTLYRVHDPDTGNEEIRLGSELKDGFGLRVAAGKTARRVISRAAGK